MGIFDQTASDRVWTRGSESMRGIPDIGACVSDQEFVFLVYFGYLWELPQPILWAEASPTKIKYPLNSPLPAPHGKALANGHGH